MNLRGLTAVVAAVATGCLASPPASIERDGGGDGDGGGDAGGCRESRDGFAGDALGGLWDDPERYGRTNLTFQSEALVLYATPDGDAVVGDIEIYSLAQQTLAGSVLRAELRSYNEGSGQTGVGWFRSSEEFFLIEHVAGAIRSTVGRPEVPEVTVCAPCADYLDGQLVIGEIREEGGMIRFSVTVNGKDMDLGETPDTGEPYVAYLYAYAPVDWAEIRVDEVSWSDCSSL